MRASRWVPRAGDPPPLQLLEWSFDALPGRLSSRIVDYLRDGRLPRFGSLVDEAGRRAFDRLDAEVRAPFYLSLDRVDRGDDAVLLRLGVVLAGLHVRLHDGPPGVPPAVWALLADAERSVFSSWTEAPEFTTLPIGRLRALLAMAGTHDDDLDGTIVDILIGSSRGSGDYGPRGLQTVPGTADFAAERPGVVIARAAAFTDGGHLELARLCSAHPPLAIALAGHLTAETTAPTVGRRRAALAASEALPPHVRLTEHARRLERLPVKELRWALDAIERVPDAAGAIRLLETERARRRGAGAADLDAAIERLAVTGEAATTSPAIDLGFERLADRPVAESAAAALRAVLEAERRRRTEHVAALRRQREDVPTVRGDELDDAIRTLTGVEASLAALPRILDYLAGVAPHPGAAALAGLAAEPVLVQLADLEPVHWIRLSARPGADRFGRAPMLNVEGVADARSIHDVLVRAGCTPQEAHDVVVDRYFVGWWARPSLSAAQLGGYLRDHPEPFDSVLGLSVGALPVAWEDHRGEVLAILEAAPRLDPRYLPVVTAFATGTATTHREAARRVLEQHGLAPRIAAEALRATVADQRAAAVRWLGSIGTEASAELLRSSLSREKSPAVRAITISTLERLGHDVRAHLDPAVLGAEATAGLAKRTPVSLAWFPFDELPACRYADGSPVPPEVIRWWVTLAANLKDPSGAGLLPRYLRVLDPTSSADLSRWMLSVWIARDAAPLDDAVVLRRAMSAVAGYRRRMAEAGLGAGDDPQAIDELFDRLDRERADLSAAPSGIRDRGLLALASAIPGAELAATVRRFMARNHLERAQIDSLMHVLADSDDAEALQLLVATARRYRTAGIQQTATELVERVASRRGWSADILADHMIPTLGLDVDRSLVIDYGPRRFVASFGRGLTLDLVDPEGVPLKSLPDPRVDEPAGPAAKAAFAAARKEARALVALQRRRLYDAMCVRREWTGEEWRELLLEHPVMGAMIAGLVWQVDGRPVRPGLDGLVRDLAGEPAEVPLSSRVTVAHPTTLTAADAEACRAAVAPVALGIDQLRAQPIDAGEEPERDREGLATTAFGVRNWARTREWDRGPTGDDVRFEEYVKTFPAVGIQAVLSFSGSSLPEVEQPVELGALGFRRVDGRGRPGVGLRPSEVPLALRAEVVADYRELPG